MSTTTPAAGVQFLTCTCRRIIYAHVQAGQCGTTTCPSCGARYRITVEALEPAEPKAEDGAA